MTKLVVMETRAHEGDPVAKVWGREKESCLSAGRAEGKKIQASSELTKKPAASGGWRDQKDLMLPNERKWTGEKYTRFEYSAHLSKQQR